MNCRGGAGRGALLLRCAAVAALLVLSLLQAKRAEECTGPPALAQNAEGILDEGQRKEAPVLASSAPPRGSENRGKKLPRAASLELDWTAKQRGGWCVVFVVDWRWSGAA